MTLRLNNGVSVQSLFTNAVVVAVASIRIVSRILCAACFAPQSVRDLMEARVEKAAGMDCDAIEPDNMSVSLVSTRKPPLGVCGVRREIYMGLGDTKRL